MRGSSERYAPFLRVLREAPHLPPRPEWKHTALEIIQVGVGHPTFWAATRLDLAVFQHSPYIIQLLLMVARVCAA